MSFPLILAAVLLGVDVFQDKTTSFNQKQEWELVFALVLLVLGVVVYIWRDHDE